jgi:hypothetical protein
MQYVQQSIYFSGLVTAVAVFRNPNTIPFCLTTDLLLNVRITILQKKETMSINYLSFRSCDSCRRLPEPKHHSFLFNH